MPFCLNWRIRIHAQEIAENALDLAHFCKVHTYKEVPKLDQFLLDGPKFFVSMTSKRNFLKKEGPIKMDITYHGIGVVVSEVKSFGGVQLKVLLLITPIDEEHLDVFMKVAILKSTNPFKNLLLRCLLPIDVRREFSRDIPVWESKIYRQRPLLCHNEVNIIRVRKWAQQFYLNLNDKLTSSFLSSTG